MSAPGRAALVTLIVITLFAFVFPLVWTIPPEATDPAHSLAGPSGAHPLGTDELGRDVLSRLAHGGQVTLIVGVAAMLTALLAGMVVGGVAGFYGGWTDTILMRLTDGMLAIPGFFLVLVVVTVIGSDLFTLILVIGCLS
ncbi:MAG: peptide/nickel transport system permease protein, partial [Chloroflexota bacterium]|nr:peptide/nickel transport system permease protein [Chloroflexota bacterium]